MQTSGRAHLRRDDWSLQDWKPLRTVREQPELPLGLRWPSGASLDSGFGAAGVSCPSLRSGLQFRPMSSSTIPRRRSSAPNHSAHSGNTGRPKRTARRCKTNSGRIVVQHRSSRFAVGAKRRLKEHLRKKHGVPHRAFALRNLHATFCRSPVFRPVFRRTRGHPSSP